MSDSNGRVRFSDVGKAYRRHHLKSFLLRELLPGRTPELAESDVFWALSDVSFEIGAGETVAILGANGSGKSTTLRLVAGASHPTRGQVSVRGRVAPVLALGVGFEPDMTAAENAYVNASLLGLGPDDVTQRLPAIMEFADLGDFANVPIRHYSNGMIARLGFAVAMHVDADILLIDEVLAVGDGAFQKKCLARLRELGACGSTLLMATHDLTVARELCERGLWIKRGRLEADGPISDVVDAFAAALGVDAA
jgi:ABC-type polysaccharide/polyol phosphate transport system ATPase subunit